LHHPCRMRMKITIVQNDIHRLAPNDNCRTIEEMICSAAKSDLYVLPEMWNTGFCTDSRNIGADSAQQALSFMQTMAQRMDAAICGSIAEKNCSSNTDAPCTYRNRCYFMRSDGSFDFYDKHHLFAYGGEDKWFKAGNQRVVTTWRGWRFMLLVCYDLRFPCWARYRDDYDAIIVVANWASERIAAWDVLTRARAIENQCYVIACNRMGEDRDNKYCGHSRIVSPDGTIIAHGDRGEQTAITAQLSLDDLQSHRQRYGFLNDRDNK